MIKMRMLVQGVHVSFDIFYHHGPSLPQATVVRLKTEGEGNGSTHKLLVKIMRPKR